MLLPGIQATPTSVSFPQRRAGPHQQRQPRDDQEHRGGRPHHLRTPPGRQRAEELCAGKADVHRLGNRPRQYLQSQRAIRAPTRRGGRCGHARGQERCRSQPERGPRRKRRGAGRRQQPALRHQLRVRSGSPGGEPPDAGGFSHMVLVRNAKRYPRNPEDGASVKHRAGLATWESPPVASFTRCFRDLPAPTTTATATGRPACT